MGSEMKQSVNAAPAVSVVVPVYNVEKYLRQCLDSIRQQTLADFEVILVDDGSTDSSYDICREYAAKDARFRAFRKENGGASSARNFGLDRAAGRYVYFPDSDDYLVPAALEKMHYCAERYGADLVFTEARTIDESGRDAGSQYDFHRQYEPAVPYRMMTEMMDHKEFHVGTPFFFLKKQVFTENHLRFKEGIMAEDMIMAYQLFCLAERGAHVHEKLYIRRYRPNSVTTSKKTERNYISAATVYREVARLWQTLPESKQSPKHVIRCAFNVLDIYRHMPSDVRKKNKEDHKAIIHDILEKDAYGDKALKLDCKSHLLWGAYKLKKKVFR